MKRTIIIFIIASISSLFILHSAVFAKENKRIKDVVLQKDAIVNHDYFAAGQSVIISGTINGDAYIAGGNVVVEGTINGDLLAAGGQIYVRGKVSNNIRAVGGQINIGGEAGRNVSVAGGSVEVADSAKIDGNLAGASGNLLIFGPILGSLNAAAGNLTLAGTVGFDANAAVGKLLLTPNAKIMGNLTYWSRNKAQISTGAQILGTVSQKVPPELPVSKKPEVRPEKTFAGFLLFFKVVSFVSILMIGILLIKFLPRYVQETSRTVSEKFFQSVGIGFITLIVVPILVFIFLATLVGIPLGLILFFGFLIFLYLAKIFVAIVIGQKIFAKLGRKYSTVWSFVLGLILYSIIGIIPVIGILFSLIVTLTGLGALVITEKDFYFRLKSKQLI